MPERPRDLEFANRLKELLQQKGIKRNSEFAAAIGKPPTLTWSWMHGRIPINRSDLELLCNFFKRPLDYLLFGKPVKVAEYRIDIGARDKDRELIERTEGKFFAEKLVPIPIAKDPISAGSPREVGEDPDGVAVIYRDWAKNRENFTVIRVKGDSMKPTIEDGSLVGIDHSKRDLKSLDRKIVALRKNGEATIKRLMVISKDLFLGMPDNPDYKADTLVLKGEEINDAIVGKVAWWWGKQR